MYLCDPCHGRYECPAKKHELLFWAKCDLCRRERDCFDCLPGAKKRVVHEHSEAMKVLKSYGNVLPISYPAVRRRT